MNYVLNNSETLSLYFYNEKKKKKYLHYFLFVTLKMIGKQS